MTWEGGASPAAAAAVSRVLSDSGLKKAVEIQRGVELEGYWAAPSGDHVRVEWAPGPFCDDAAQEDARIKVGLTRCEQALAKYEVARTTAEVAFPGAWREVEVLEVRSR